MLAILGVMLSPLAAQARYGRGHEPEAAGRVAEFDYYLLSLSIAPSFCALSPANQAHRECEDLTEDDFQRTPLTIHGLWPNRAGVSVNLQPHDCEGPPFAVSEPVQAALRRYMPGGPGLERYEWRKHGTCSGLPPDVYFATVARLGERANGTIGVAMRDNGMLGNVMRIADLLAAVAAKDPLLASAIVVDCRVPRGGGDALVDEIRVVLSKDLRPMRAAEVGLGQNSGCPHGAGRVPDVAPR